MTLALEERCVSGIYRVCCDSDGDSLTLRQFRNNIFQHLKSDDFLKLVGAVLKRVSFETRLQRVQARIVEIRHQHVAHLQREPTMSKRVPLSDLQEATDALQELFWWLSFGRDVRFEFLDLDESTEEVVLAMAKWNFLFEEPEEHPERWPYQWESFTDEQKLMYNAYRTKLRRSTF